METNFASKNTECRVMSRKAALDFAQKCEEDAVIISISDSYDMSPRFSKNPHIKEILKLHFDDIDINPDSFNEQGECEPDGFGFLVNWKKDTGEILQQYIDDKGQVYYEVNYDVFTQSQANVIADFVNEWYGKVDLIVVHCNAGISRSSGICAAILNYKKGDDSCIWQSKRYRPNKYCYKLLIDAFLKQVMEN